MTQDGQQTTIVEPLHLLGKVEEFRKQGFRLVQMHCTKVGDIYEINYSFDLNYEFRNIRVITDGKTEIPSISGIYGGRSSTRTRCTTSSGSGWQG